MVDKEHFFVLGQVRLPIHESDEFFIWLVWVSLSQANFQRMSDLWETEGRENEPPYFGWLQTILPYEPSTINLKTMVHTSPVGERPWIELEPTNHPLALEQQRGITLARAQEIAQTLLHS
jgi:hypothetical protein